MNSFKSAWVSPNGSMETMNNVPPVRPVRDAELEQFHQIISESEVEQKAVFLDPQVLDERTVSVYCPNSGVKRKDYTYRAGWLGKFESDLHNGIFASICR